MKRRRCPPSWGWDRPGRDLAPYTTMKVGGPAGYFAATEQMLKVSR
jgi:hypothetical protein